MASRDSLLTGPAVSSDHVALAQRYRGLELLSEGGLGSVYRAEDVVRSSHVALKRLKPATDARATEVARKLLENEYHTLKQLQHPSIIEVYDYGIDAELGPYYTMELLSGQDLHELSPLPWREACRLLMDVASSLAVMHSRRLLHRDISARNVRRTADGSAKLLDFGALAQMGVMRNLVGTPPYVPPEAVHQQSLDGRSDLYALGALAYFVLTRQHAFPARDFAQLKALWYQRPRSVCTFDRTIPVALAALIQSLLEVDALARPQSAAEVMARLSAIADLPLTEAVAVRRAYLATPKLVARDASLLRARTQLVRALRGEANTLVVRGAAGMGRSRFIDASVLDAELAGALVLRADATDGTTPFGVMRRLLRCLLAARGALRERALQLQLDALLVENDAGEVPSTRREALIANTTQLLLHASRRRLIAIAVDDAHAIDEPSLALLANLANEAASQRLFLAVSVETATSTEPNLALELLAQAATEISLCALDASDTRALLASVFGDIPRLDLLATLVQESCVGIPRDIMDAALRLVETDLARYAGGQWVLSDDPGQIRACLEHASDVQVRLGRLPATAVELLELLALDRDHKLDESDYAALCRDSEPSQRHAALTELTSQRWLLRVDGTHHFVRASDRRGIEQALDPARKRTLHARIAEHLHAAERSAVHEVYHFVHAGQASRAHAAMRRYLEFADKNPQRIRAAIELDTIERLVQAGAAEAWSLPILTQYRTQLMLLGAASGAWERVLPLADATLGALADYAGLSDFHALAHLTPAERLGAAMKATAERHAAWPAGTHPLPPLAAVRSLTRACTLAAASAYWMVEPAAFLRIPSLAPLLPLSAALGLTERIVNAFRALTQGQEWAGWDAFKQLYSDVRVMPDTQLDPRSRYTLELVVLSPVCFRAARHAASTTLGLCAALAPTQPDQAQNYTMLYYIAMGDPVAAEHAREQCEVLTLRAGATNDTRLTRLQTTAWLYPLADDLMGLKRVAEELERVSEQRPGWRFTRDLVKAHALRTQGQAAKALMLIESLLKELPTAHYDFAPSAEAHVMILTQLARFEAAWSAGESYRERARACDIPTAWLDLALADCLARLARHEQAESLWQGALTALAQRDIGGMHLGYAYEVGARIARSRDDWEAFSDRADRCAEYYLPGRSPALIAKHRRLLDQTREADEQVVEPSAPTDDAVQTALSQCTDRIQRGQQACALICEYTKAAEAVLFGVRAGQLEAFTDSASVPQGMLFAVQSYLSVERDRDAEITCTAAAGEFADAARTEAVQTIEEPGHYTLGEHRYAPLLLRASDERGDYVVGVAMLRMSSTPIQVAAQRFVPNLSKALLANGDVDSLRLS